MNSVDFCYWLQGHFELTNSDDLSPEQVRVIRNHLNLVFKHEIDPLRDSQTTTPKDVLQQVHDGEKPKWPMTAPDNPKLRC